MVIVLTGPMGCGKTTIGKLLANRLGWRFADGDDFHPPANIAKMKAGLPLDDEDRYPWLHILHAAIEEAVADNVNLILACSALKREYRRLLGINQQSVISVYLQGSPDLLRERIESRTHLYMDKSLLESQLRTLEEPETGMIVCIADTPDVIVDSIISSLSV